MENCKCAVYYQLIPQEFKNNKELLRYQKAAEHKLLQQAFFEFFHTEIDLTCIKREKNGKPYYEKNKACYFNISHCKKAIVLAVSTYPVGADVETIRRVNAASAVKCCTEKELCYVLGHEKKEMFSYKKGAFLNDEEAERFLNLWTLKESYVKMTGEGIRRPLNLFEFDLQNKKDDCIPFLWNGEGNLKKSVSFQWKENGVITAISLQCDDEIQKNDFYISACMTDDKIRKNDIFACII